MTRTACTVTRCTLTVTVTDAGYSAGIKALQASRALDLPRQVHQARPARGVHAPPDEQAKVASLSANRFKVVASKLPVGTQRFTLVAVDKAGHRQAMPTTKTVKTKKPRKRR